MYCVLDAIRLMLYLIRKVTVRLRAVIQSLRPRSWSWGVLRTINIVFVLVLVLSKSFENFRTLLAITITHFDSS